VKGFDFGNQFQTQSEDMGPASSPDVKILSQRAVVRDYENSSSDSSQEEVDAEVLIVQWNLPGDE